MIKIFHTGDNHLDSSFSSLSPSVRERERARQRELFAKMMEFVKENNYDLVLISGDLFDSPDVSPETERTVTEAFSGLSCPVVISPGNHDPYGALSIYSSGKLPENVYVFSSRELQVFELDEPSVKVCGYAFEQGEYYEPPLKDSCLASLDGIKLLCAHTELGASVSKYAPITIGELEASGVIYAALGHLHKLAEPIKIGKGLAAYCGFPEGRAFDELGEGGALTVYIDGGTVSVKREIFAERKYLCEELDTSGAESDSEVIERIRALISEKQYGTNTALRLTLTGTVGLYYSPDISLIKRMLSESLLELEIRDMTLPEFDFKSLENDHTLRGEVYRELLPRLNGEDDEEKRIALEALKVALLAIEGRRITY